MPSSGDNSWQCVMKNEIGCATKYIATDAQTRAPMENMYDRESAADLSKCIFCAISLSETEPPDFNVSASNGFAEEAFVFRGRRSRGENGLN